MVTTSVGVHAQGLVSLSDFVPVCLPSLLGTLPGPGVWRQTMVSGFMGSTVVREQMRWILGLSQECRSCPRRL